MALVDPTAFDNQDVALVYVAARLKEGKRVEQVLSDHGIDFAVDCESFQTRLLGILTREYEGVGFYVLSAHAAVSRRILREVGLVQGLVDEPDD
jgi:hypothetical protein